MSREKPVMETHPESSRASAPRAALAPRIASERLMNGRREIIIEHGPEEYRLRITGAGKLLLTK